MATGAPPDLTAPEAPGEGPGHHRPRRTGALVGGGLTIAVAVVLLLAGAAALVLWLTQRDGDGYFTLPSERFATTSHAITAERVHLSSGSSGEWLLDRTGATLRLRVRSLNGRAVFLGIAPAAAVDRWLAGVTHDRVVDIHGDVVDYERSPGRLAPGPPARQRFWEASASGPGVQTLRWRPHSGDWTAVVARADGRAGIDVRGQIGVKTTLVLWIAMGLLVAAACLCALAAALIAWGLRGRGQLPPPALPQAPRST